MPLVQSNHALELSTFQPYKKQLALLFQPSDTRIPSDAFSIAERLSMLTEEGVVEKLLQQKARIRIKRSSSCASCESRGLCQTLNDREATLEVENHLHAQVGDRVEVSMNTQSLLKVSLLVYILPIVTLIIGAYVGQVWAQARQMPPTIPSILAGGAAMGLTFWVLKRLERTAQEENRYQPRMTRILLSGGAPETGDSR
jgi:sigma-E factor negative regulatory protein RseC